VFYPPGLNEVIAGTMLGLIYVYNYNALISIVAMCKMYIALRAYSYFSRWTTDVAKSICNKHNVRMGLHFTLKAELKKRPMVVLSIMMIFSLGICSYSMRTFEYGVVSNTEYSNTAGFKGASGNDDLSTILNCMWLVIVTMTTVGYGDYYPRSHLGRFVGVISCIIGMLLVSLMVVALTSLLDFSNEEKKAYSLIKKLNAHDNADSKAIDVIKTILMIRKTVSLKKQMGVNSLSERFILFTQLKRKITIFKNDYKIANSYALPLDEMLRLMEKSLRYDIERMSTCINNMGKISDDLEKISNDQDDLSSRMDNVLRMQEDVSQYVINFNNKTFQQNLAKRNNGKRISTSTKNILAKLNRDTPEGKKKPEEEKVFFDSPQKQIQKNLTTNMTVNYN